MLLEVILIVFNIVLLNGHPNLLITTTKDVRIVSNFRPNKPPTIVKELEGGAGVDFYYAGGQVCWTDQDLQMIQCSTVNGTGSSKNKVTVVSNDIMFPDGLACDWLTQKLYWTDADKGRLEVVTLDGRYRKILFWEDIDQPRAIGLVPTEGLMFWTDWGDVPKIERASMDGNLESRKVIVSENIFWPNGLTVDFVNRKLYWVDGKLRFIEVMDYDGKNRRTVVEKVVVYPYALSMYKNRLFWTDWNLLSVYSLELGVAEPRELLHYMDMTPVDIRVMEPERQPYRRTGCDVDNGRCSHLCLLSAVATAGYSCACPTGVKLVDNYTCANGPEELLLLAQMMEIGTISLDSPDHTCVQLPLKGIKHAIDISYDPIHGLIYWTDEEARMISRARLDGSGQEGVVSSDLVNPDGLAVDWRAQNLYWIDAGTDRIQVLRINTTYTKVLINSDLLEPRSIAVSPDEGLMFWSDWNDRNPKLERAALDGSARGVLVKDGLGWPNGITLDIPLRKVYFCDAKTEKIEMIGYNGGGRKEVVTDNLPHVFGLTLLGDYLYWTDWQRRSIESAHKITGANRKVILEQQANMMGLKAVRPLGKSSTMNPCVVNNGNCHHLCLNTPTKYVCSCQMGYEVDSNGRSCFVPEAFLLFARKENIGRISIENAQNDAIIPVSGIKDASSLNFDISDDRIYWTDVKAKAITRAFINGSHVEKVIEFGLESPEGLTVDWLAKNVYWTDTGTRRIEVAKLDGWYRRAIIWTDLIEPRSITVDPYHEFIYWSDWGGEGSLNKSRLDGSHFKPVLTKLGRANSLTLDLADRKIYWCAVQGFIESAWLDGSHRTVVATSPRPFAMTLYQDKIYWSDWQTNGLYSANKQVGSNQTLVHSRLEQVTSIVVYQEWGGGGGEPCGGQCAALCLGRCACPTHYTLTAHNTCLPPSSFILLSTKNTVSRLLLNTSECPDAPLPIHGLKNVRALDFDPLLHTLYWIDGGRSQSIRKWSVSGQGSSGGGRPAPVLTGIERAYSLAVDPYHRLLYWSSVVEGTINATHLENASTPVVIVKSHDSDKPRHIALHPLLGLLVWVAVGHDARIYSSRLDGSARSTLVSGLGQDVSVVTVDQLHNTVYWMTSNSIESIDIHGRNRRDVVRDNLQKVSYLAVLGNSLYWVQMSRVLVYNRGSGKTRTAFNSQYHITTLTAVTTPHAKIRDGWICADGQQVSSPLECEAESSSCGQDQLLCAGTRGDCIPMRWRCDGVADCHDASDEAHCPVCPPDTFTCAQGHCIDKAYVCDGVQHCRDRRDERGCCAGHECGGRCVPPEAVCDGWSNCDDGSDESAAACRARRQAARPASPSGPRSHSLLVVGVGVALCFVAAGLAYYKCHPSFDVCCRTKPGGGACESLDPALDPLSPSGGYRCGTLVMGPVRLSSLDQGCGSSTAATLCYPVNPPPSPATTRSKERPLYRPPPPTPCSTDVAHDTDSNYQGDGEPVPPPPTPTSLSPSSSTYFNPAPPPPSPTP